MNVPPLTDELRLQVHQACLLVVSCEATAEEEALLWALVESNESARRFYLECVEVEFALSLQFGRTKWAGTDSLRPASDQAPVAPDVSLPQTESLVGYARRGRRVWETIYDIAADYFALSLLVSGLFMAIVLLSLGHIRPVDNRNQLPEGGKEVVTIVAEITGSNLASWDKSSMGNHKSTALLADDKLVLNSGLAEITYETGAKVVLEGPAEYWVATRPEDVFAKTVDGGRGDGMTNSGVLKHGKVTVVADSPASKGFTIFTAKAHIIDLGTVFGVHVDDSGAAELHVFQGKVEAAILGSENEVVDRYQFTTGQAASIDASTGRIERFVAERIGFAGLPSRGVSRRPTDEIVGVLVTSATYSAVERVRERMIDGSGLTEGGHDTVQTNQWDSSRRDQMAECVINFDLGRIYTLNRIHVWNWNNLGASANMRGVKEAEIFVADSAGGSYESLGMFEFLIASGADGDPGFDIPDFPEKTIARYVRFRIVSNFVGPFGTDTAAGHDRVGLAEIRFYRQLAEEP